MDFFSGIITICILAYIVVEYMRKKLTEELSKSFVLFFIIITCFTLPTFVWNWGLNFLDWFGWFYFLGILLGGLLCLFFSGTVRTAIYDFIRHKIHLFKLSTWCIIFLVLSLINSIHLKMLEQSDKENLKKEQYAFMAYSKERDKYYKKKGIVFDSYQKKEIIVKYCYPVLIKDKIVYFIVSDKGLFTLEDNFALTKKMMPNYGDYVQYADSLIDKTFIVEPPYFSLFQYEAYSVENIFPSTQFEIYGCQNINPYAFIEKKQELQPDKRGTK